ncbi:LysR family transcriptional regulator [Plantibacter flavus]|uniref:LysR family transcriptional regulator n=1 Tax=Plantibacter flavus TaxID=150123 RepID=UPI003F139775
MNVDLRQLRTFVAIVDEGSFTDAALALDLSQAAVSRSLAALERQLGVRLLRRTTREWSLTAAGSPVLGRARRVLAEVDELVREAQHGPARLRLGYAWSAVGRHTVALQRRWAAEHGDIELDVIRTNSPSSGLEEGRADLSIVRSTPDERRFASTIVGLERRFCAMAADDPLARRRLLRLTDLVDRRIVIDRRTGTTALDLWPEDARPSQVSRTENIDDWLALIASGRALGMTSEATVAQYPRPGIAYRRVVDAPLIPVHLVWWREEPPPATEALRALLVELYQAP